VVDALELTLCANRVAATIRRHCTTEHNIALHTLIRAYCRVCGCAAARCYPAQQVRAASITPGRSDAARR
jgi:hypothetical protein